VSLERAKTDLAAIEAEIAELQVRAEKLRAYIEVAPKYEAFQGREEPELPSLSKDSPLYGKGLAEACVIVLEMAQAPLTAAEVTASLKREGWHFVSGDPPTLIAWALRDLNKRTARVLRMPNSRWAMTSWRPPHVAKSVAGLNAARRRGVQLGAPRKVTEEMVRQMEALAKSGKTIEQIAQTLGVSQPTVKRYRRAAKGEPTPKGQSEDLEPNIMRPVR